VGENHPKAPCFCVPSSILATFDRIFEPWVGNFCGDFLSKSFFDSLVGLPLEKSKFLVMFHKGISAKTISNETLIEES